MKRPIYSNLISGLLNVLVCIAAATLILISQDWLGKGDLYAFVFWTIPPAASLSVCGVSIIRLIRFKNLFFRILMIISLAVVISFAWLYCVYLFLGPWINKKGALPRSPRSDLRLTKTTCLLMYVLSFSQNNQFQPLVT